MKLAIVAGGRKYNDLKRVMEVIQEESPTFIIEGDASGADTLAGKAADVLGIDYIKVPALWNARGNPAGHRRNALMARILVKLADGNPMMLIAFPGGTGTAGMVKIAESLNIPVRKVDF